MDFLARHYEKLILAVCLLSLIWCNAVVTLRKEQSEKQTQQLAKELGDVSRLLHGDKLLDPLEESTLDTLGSMLSVSGVGLGLTNYGSSRRPALFESTQFIVCKNRECAYILPYNTDTCPYCKTAQAPLGKDLTMTDDLDEDGIPDLVERAVEGLDHRYPWDSNMDFDGDGFLNIEEYRAALNSAPIENDSVESALVTQVDALLNDGSKTPDLAYLLRVRKPPEQRALPFRLKRVKDSGSPTDKSVWKGTFTGLQGGRDQDVKIGDDIPGTGYRLTGFADDKLSVRVEDGSGTEYTVEAGKALNERNYTIDFIYLQAHVRARQIGANTRSAAQMRQPLTEEQRAHARQQRAARGGGMMGGDVGMGGMDTGSGSQTPLFFSLHEGDKFFLEFTPTGSANRGGEGGLGGGTMGGADAELRTEFYQVLPVETVEVPAAEEGAQPTTRLVVRVQRISALEGGSPVGKPVEISVLDNSPKSHDYPRGGDGMGGGMGPGMGGMM